MHVASLVYSLVGWVGVGWLRGWFGVGLGEVCWVLRVYILHKFPRADDIEVKLAECDESPYCRLMHLDEKTLIRDWALTPRGTS